MHLVANSRALLQQAEVVKREAERWDLVRCHAPVTSLEMTTQECVGTLRGMEAKATTQLLEQLNDAI